MIRRVFWSEIPDSRRKRGSHGSAFSSPYCHCLLSCSDLILEKYMCAYRVFHGEWQNESRVLSWCSWLGEPLSFPADLLCGGLGTTLGSDLPGRGEGGANSNRTDMNGCVYRSPRHGFFWRIYFLLSRNLIELERLIVRPPLVNKPWWQSVLSGYWWAMNLCPAHLWLCNTYSFWRLCWPASPHSGIEMYALEEHLQPFQKGCALIPGIRFCLTWNCLSKPRA